MTVALAASAVVVIGVVLILFFVFRKKMRSSPGIGRDSSINQQTMHYNMSLILFIFLCISPMGITATNISEHMIETRQRRFTYIEVVEMTKSFQRALGEGGFGVVYHGYLNDSDQLAVKVLSQSSSQGYKHFKAEVRYANELLPKLKIKRWSIYISN